MVVSINRPTQLIIDKNAIRQNIESVKKNTPESLAVFAVVKANGYGHGAVPIAKVAAESGVDGFCVATIDEGIELREAGLTQPILVLGLVSVYTLPLVSEFQLSIPIGTREWIEEALSFYQENGWTGKVLTHLALDTGMGRIGFRDSRELQEAEQLLSKSQAFHVEGVFTHFATADEADTQYWEEQFSRFNQMIDVLQTKPTYIHLENSATNLWHKPVGNVVRLGIAMYGLNPSGTALDLPYHLTPALSLESKLMQVKQVPKGSGIGYGRTYESAEEEWIGTVPIGYADGYIRKLQGFHVLVDGVFCPIVGRVCMDQLMIRLPKKVAVGTTVTLVGQNKDKAITLQDLATYTDTIHYEVACLFTSRLPRIYK